MRKKIVFSSIALVDLPGMAQIPLVMQNTTNQNSPAIAAPTTAKRKMDNADSITRGFGIELEFIGANNGARGNGCIRTTVTDAINTIPNVIAKKQSWNQNTQPYWKVITDASLNGSPNNGEAVSPILTGEEGIKQARDVASVMQLVGADVNKLTGFHCHVDVRDLDLKQLKRVMKLWILCEDAFNAIIAPSRRNGQWANASVHANSSEAMTAQNKRIFRAIDAATTKRELGRSLGCRYHKLNATKIDPAIRGSIEFRCHQGTLDAEKIERWVRLCVSLVESAIQWKRINARQSNATGSKRLAAALSYCGVQGATRKFFLKRSREFARADQARSNRSA